MDGTVFRRVSTSDCDAQLSEEITLSIFTPSATTSVGFSFRGSGANGAPTNMAGDDIAGAHAQAYWNNLDGGSGDSGAGVYDAETEASEGLQRIAIMRPPTCLNSPLVNLRGSRTQRFPRMLNGYVRTFGSYENDDPAELVVYGLPAGTHSCWSTPCRLLWSSTTSTSKWKMPTAPTNVSAVPRTRMSSIHLPTGWWQESASDRSIGNMVRLTTSNLLMERLSSVDSHLPPECWPRCQWYSGVIEH